MDGVENVKVRDRVELSLDGRQIASIVVGALVLLGVVFVLGLNIGRQLAAKQLEAGRGDALAALDQPIPSPAIPSDELTYHDRLLKDRAPPVELTPPPAPPAAAPQVAAAPEAPAPAAKAEPKAAARPKAEPAGKPAYSVQVVATPSRAEADRLAVRLKAYAPRVEETEVSGRGRMYRVRVGAFATKPEAEKFLKSFNGQTGSKGLVVASART
jgi:septal ring-binding cell division protein DamX